MEVLWEYFTEHLFTSFAACIISIHLNVCVGHYILNHLHAIAVVTRVELRVLDIESRNLHVDTVLLQELVLELNSRRGVTVVLLLIFHRIRL